MLGFIFFFLTVSLRYTVYIVNFTHESVQFNDFVKLFEMCSHNHSLNCRAPLLLRKFPRACLQAFPGPALTPGKHCCVSLVHRSYSPVLKLCSEGRKLFRREGHHSSLIPEGLRHEGDKIWDWLGNFFFKFVIQ